MALAKVQAATLTPEQLASLSEQAQKQELSTRMPKSIDEANFPVFEPTPGAKYLLYVPNHTIVNADGVRELRMDKMLRYTVKEGNRFQNIRSIAGLVVPGTDFDGTDPIQSEGLTASFAYAKAKLAGICAKQGLNPEDKENPAVKTARQSVYGGNMEYFQPARERYTFPVVVIESEENDKGRVVPVMDADGSLKYNIYWYTVGDRTFESTWGEVFDTVDEDDIPDTIGGGLFEISYGSMEDGKAPSMRDAHRDFKTLYRQNILNKLTSIEGGADTFKKFDELTLEWTPEKAMMTVIANQLPEPVAYREMVATLVAEIEQQTQILESGDVSGAGGLSLDDLKGGGKGSATVPSAPEVAGLLPSGATDEG